jgi:outer membrane biosynthesis protein TonB
VDEIFVPAVPLRKVNPVIDPTLKFMLSRETTVDVKVSIDAQGKVVKAEPVKRDGSIAGFIATASVNAARLWSFRPARRGDRNLPSDMVVQFKFSPVR